MTSPNYPLHRPQQGEDETESQESIAMKGSAIKKQELIDLLTTRVPADQASKVEAAITGMVDAIREEVVAEIGGPSDESIREEILNLTEARDEAAERARNAEAEVAELSKTVDSQIEAAKAAVYEEYQEEIDTLNERLETVETEKDKIAAQIREDFEKEFEAHKGQIVARVSRFMEGKMNGVYDRLQEAAANDPTSLHESNVFRQIAELVGQHQYEETAGAVTDHKVEAINEEVIGLRAQVRHLEARNSRLVAETKVLREGKGTDEVSTEKGQLDETPTFSGKSDLKPSAGLADKEGNAETGDQYEPDGNVKRNQYKTGDASKNDKAKTKNEGKSESERVRDLLSEAFTADVETSEAQGEGAGWISSVKESRHNRSERANKIEGQGLGIQAEDVIREDFGTNKGKKLNESVIVPGTSTTRSEFAQLAGIAEDAE